MSKKKYKKIAQARLPERKIKKPKPEVQEEKLLQQPKAPEEVSTEKVQMDSPVEEALQQLETEVAEQGTTADVQAETVQEAETEEAPTEEEPQEAETEEAPTEEEPQEAETEEATEEEPQAQIKEWKQSETVSEDKPENSAEDSTTEKKRSILKLAGIAMLVIVVVAGIILWRTGNNGDTVAVSNDATVATPTAAAEMTATPSAERTETPTQVPSSTPILTPTMTPTPTAALTPSPEPEEELTVTPTATEAPTPTITPTPVVVGNIDVSKYDAYSSEFMGWGVGKNKEHEQPTAWGYDIKYNFDEVGAYYVDRNVSEDDKVIYLTINCGYEVGYTPECLDTLKKHDVKASFFVLEDYIHQCSDQIRRMKEEGHLVGNHSAMHLDYGNTAPEKVIADMLRNEKQMREHVGYEMDKIFRPPSGYYNEQTLHIAKDLGYKTYFWSMAYVDWDPDNQPTVEYVVDFFQVNHHNGVIPVIHITSSSGVKSLDKLITMLKEEGYRFGLVSEIK